ncbi:hypothetical protein VCHENC02_5612A, partial [Vibrio harveyi]
MPNHLTLCSEYFILELIL